MYKYIDSLTRQLTNHLILYSIEQMKYRVIPKKKIQNHDMDLSTKRKQFPPAA